MMARISSARKLRVVRNVLGFMLLVEIVCLVIVLVMT